MATKNTKLSVDIVADAIQAERVIRDVQGEARDLDNIDPKIDVTLDDNASSGIAGLKESLGGLSGLAGGAAAGGLLALASSAADAALEAQTLADLTGTSLENASRLQTVWRESAGGDANDLLDIILQMNDKLLNQPELAEQLGIEFDASKPAAQTFVEVVDALNASQLSQNEKVQLMGELFGDEGVRQVGLMIATVGDLGDAVEAVPDIKVIDDADVRRAREFKEQWAATAGYLAVAATEALKIVERLSSRPLTATDSGLVSDFERQHPELRRAGEQTAHPATARAATGTAVSNIIRQAAVTIINPPGTPAATTDQARQYEERNGPR